MPCSIVFIYRKVHVWTETSNTTKICQVRTFVSLVMTWSSCLQFSEQNRDCVDKRAYTPAQSCWSSADVQRQVLTRLRSSEQWPNTVALSLPLESCTEGNCSSFRLPVTLIYTLSPFPSAYPSLCVSHTYKHIHSTPITEKGECGKKNLIYGKQVDFFFHWR